VDEAHLANKVKRNISDEKSAPGAARQLDMVRPAGVLMKGTK
jgi:hypothetical protein